MNTKESITRAYDRASQEYAAAFWNEFERKPFDRMILEHFAAHIPQGETILEIGCGPGEVSGYLHCQGANCLGTDLSAKMIESAKQYFPQVHFEVQDFFQLSYAGGAFGGVVGFYAIVNLLVPEIETLLAEVKRVLKSDGLFLFSFHIDEGEDKTEVKDFFNQPDNPLTFYYFKVDEIKDLVEKAGFQVVDIMIRYPYPDVEYPSKRAYFLARQT
jgi:ubiquinone/menaquinone biosynthesis C-methylase UbiE